MKNTHQNTNSSKSKHTRILSLLPVAAALAITPASTASLIVNGSFETGTPPGNGSHETVSNSNVTGWTTGNGTVWYMTSSNWGGGGPVGGGDFLVNVTGNATIFQSFGVTAGTDYSVSYYEERRGGGGYVDTTLSLGGGTFISYGGGTPVGVSAGPGTSILQTTAHNTSWTLHSFTFRADTTTTATLTFANVYGGGRGGDNDGVFLDLISVDALVVARSVWTGNDNGQWVTSGNLAGTPPTNWVLSTDPLTEVNFLAGAATLFDDSAVPAGPVAVGINAADVAPGEVTFNNENKAYVLSGAFGIAGGANLIKSGAGTVTIGTPNSYTGGTTVTAGSLILTGSGTLGATSGTLTVNGAAAIVDLGTTSQTVGAVSLKSGATIDNGTLTGTSFSVESGTVGAALAGSGAALAKTTAGTVTLTGANTYDGGTTVTAGTLALSGAGTLGATTGALTVNGGTTIVDLGLTSQTVGAVSLKNGAQINNGTLTGTSFAVESGSIGADLSGTGAVLTKTTTGTVALSGANTYDGGTNINDGVLALGSSGALGATGAISFGGGKLQFSAGNTTDYSARFSADPSQAYALDTNGQDVTFATALTSVGGTLAKSGAGTLTLAVANTHTGTTVVSGGALKLGHNQALQNSTVSAVTGGGLAFATGVTSPTLGGLTGAVNVALTTESAEDVALTVDGNGQSTTYSGTLSGGNGLTKAGVGTLTVTAAQAYAGPTIVSDGTLKLTGQNAVQLITNGSFETGTPPGNGSHENVASSNVTGWTTGGSSGIVWYMTSSNWGGGGPTGGGNFLVNVNGTMSIFQSFGVTAGTDYSVSYYEEQRGGGGYMDTTLSLGGGTFISYGGGTPVGVSSPSATTLLQTTAVNAGWTLHSFTFRPDTTTTATLTFANAYIPGVTGDNDGVFLDRVSVTSTVQTPNLLPISTPVSIGDNATLDLSDTNQKIASLADAAGPTPTGHRVLFGGATLTIGAASGETTFTGAILSTVGDGSAVEKVDASVQNLNGAQTYDSLTVTAGTLNVNGELGTTPATGTASVVVADNAMLKFGSVSQTLSSLTIGAGATVTFTSGVASGAFSGGGSKGLNLGTAAVPEPGTLGLLLTGALGMLKRRRRQA
ncbi:MAG: autotransporter-associated beta strand repeat-containing protein [Chthoniobacter sp.]|nr:autotransporter-associated beta strand repeat-containing protein [Chthoniobacter sp.]